MNSKYDELELFREDIAAVKTAVTLLRDWIGEKFGEQVFDQNLLKKRTCTSSANPADNSLSIPTIPNDVLETYNLKPRMLLPMRTKTTPSQLIEGTDFRNELPEMQFNINNQPIHIIHHINCSSDAPNLTEGLPIRIQQELQPPFPPDFDHSRVEHSTEVPIILSSESFQLERLDPASTSTSYVLELPANDRLSSPTNVDHFHNIISSSNGSTVIPENDISKSARSKKRRKTKSKGTPPAKSTEDSNNQIQCDICGKFMNGAAAMKRHAQTHKNSRPHICTDCGKCFQRSFHLKTHRMIHTGEKKHQCRFCGRLFLLPKDLICHERFHTGEKPFICPESGCSRKFNLNSHLKMHLRTHTGEKPYKCDKCQKCFTQANSLRVHKKTHIKISDPSLLAPNQESSLLLSINPNRNTNGNVTESSYPTNQILNTLPDSAVDQKNAININITPHAHAYGTSTTTITIPPQE